MGAGKGTVKRVNTMDNNAVDYEQLTKFKIKNLNTEELKNVLLYQLMQTDITGDELSLVINAIALAEDLHKNDKRSNGPYIDHVFRCAVRANKYLQVEDADIISSTVMHDIYEDHKKELEELGKSNLPTEILKNADDVALAYLAYRFNDNVANLVKSLSNPKFTGTTKPERDVEYAENIKKKIKNFPTFLIKLSDFTDNAVGLHFTHGTKHIMLLAKKYYPCYDIFEAQAKEFRDSGKLTDQQFANIFMTLSQGKQRTKKYLDLIS